MPNTRRMMMAAAGQGGSEAPHLEGELWSWGRNHNGQLAQGDTTDISSPVQVGSATNWLYMGLGASNMAAINADNELWVCGYNSFGQLGQGNTTNVSTLVQVGSLTDWADVACGSQHTMAIKTDGTLWGIGRNNWGHLGDGSTTNRSSPVQIGSLTDWASIATTEHASFAIKTNGTMWAWGHADNGQLGTGTSESSNESSPVQIGSLTTWSSLGTIVGRTCSAIKTDGTLWMWGRNNWGNLGQGNTTNTSSPVQVGSLTNWGVVSSASACTLAAKTDGTLWTWGRGYYGRIGDGTTVDKSSPVQIGSLTNWSFGASSINAGSGTAHVVKQDGTLWGWGFNKYWGGVGDGTKTHRSSPVQIGSLTTWQAAYDGNQWAFGIKIPS